MDLLGKEGRITSERTMTEIGEANLNLAHGLAEAARLAPRLVGVQCSWAIATILHRAVEYFGRDVLFATRAADVRLPPSVEPWEPQFRPLALEQLKRIVSNYRERNLPSSSATDAVFCKI